MSALPPTADALSAPRNAADGRLALDERDWERSLDRRLRGARWIGWRLRALVLAALIGCLALFLAIRTVGAVPALPVELHANELGVLLYTDAAGTPHVVRGVIDANGRITPLDILVLQRSARWLVGDAERTRHAVQHDALARALTAGSLHLAFDDGRTLTLNARAHSASGMGAVFWLASTLALLLYLVTIVVLLVRPELRNALYAVMTLAQVGNLLFLAAESLSSLGLPPGFMRWDHDLRAAFDLATVAALVHATSLHPRRLPGARGRAVAVWLALVGLSVGVLTQSLPNAWWWTQATIMVFGLLAIAQLAWMQRLSRHPLITMLLRYCTLMVGTLLLLTASIAAAGPTAGSQGQAVAVGAAIWVVFVAAMLLMLPFMARTQQLMREFSLLAGVSTVATSLDLLFVAVFSLGNFASLTLALFIALGVYAGLRQWLLNRMMARERVTTARMFEQTYRVARAMQASPHGVGEQLASLLRDLFEPIEVNLIARHTSRSRSHVLGEGTSLLVPVPRLDPDKAPAVIVLGFAQHGQRLFTTDDARLSDQVIEQLTRAVAFDQAVERGRSEERARIAQDLHDDIGARLLTLMYQAPTREMEDYLRHTLKDLKTLTRGLAAPNHPLSHAVAEWKADIAQRLSAADCELSWTFNYGSDIELSVAQWSALTRVLRELVSNAMAHAQATRVIIEASLERGVLTLAVIDDGCGRNPQAWSHGLGLGGVRKRVKQLGGSVQWSENDPQGIACRVTIPSLGGGSAD